MYSKVKQMLEIGDERGLVTVGEAYQNYLLHWDCFFSVDNLSEEINHFTQELETCGLLTETISGDYYELRDISILDALVELIKAGGDHVA